VTQPQAARSDPAQLGELLTAVQATARMLLSDLPSHPRRVHLRAGDVLVELEWAAASPMVPPTAAAEQDAPEPALTYIRADLVGTFYQASEPGAKPFVAAGDLVEPGQQVGILEAMKLMTPVHADRFGRIAEILVANGEAVEYGQPLLAVEPGTEE
jgi:acetyl-CoA carboxylase biotin carboxyl carrier protein